jgi:hypothetical protein
MPALRTIRPKQQILQGFQYMDDRWPRGPWRALVWVALVASLGLPSPSHAAALAWAEGLRFHPAQVDGRPQAGSFTFAVTFKLSD